MGIFLYWAPPPTISQQYVIRGERKDQGKGQVRGHSGCVSVVVDYGGESQFQLLLMGRDILVRIRIRGSLDPWIRTTDLRIRIRILLFL